MLLMLAWACRLHHCLSFSGKEFICWIKTALRHMLDESVLCIFCLLRCGLAPAIKTAPQPCGDDITNPCL